MKLKVTFTNSYNQCLVVIGIFGLITICSGQTSIDEYMQLRNDALAAEQALSLGSDLALDSLETQVNEILMAFKHQEYSDGLDTNGDYFGATRHFFHSKPYIESSNVFQIIKMLPKGAALHMHDFTVGSSDYIAYNLTYWDNLYSCIGDDEHLLFRFFNSFPAQPCFGNNNWTLVTDLRNGPGKNARLVDEWFARSMSMVTPTPEVAYPTANRAWYWFEKKITTISSLANYAPALRAYYYHTLQEFLDDNVQYIEMRGLLTGVYNLDQTELTEFEALTLFKEVTDEFVANNPNFWGGKYIYAPHRFHPNSQIQNMLNQAIQMKEMYQDYFAGFDLVGQEDIGTPLIEFLPELLNGAANGVRYFFHSGETDWRGTKIDENILDAILLNTTRFGHGYAISAHPYLRDLAKQRGIAVESCPISNQVLRLVEDFRNHPASILLTKDFPLVVASDGPGIWGSTGLSHDWYIMFMAIGGQMTDLRTLKQFAINSIEYSAMNSTEKAEARAKWEIEWTKFLENVIARFGSKNKGKVNEAYPSVPAPASIQCISIIEFLFGQVTGIFISFLIFLTINSILLTMFISRFS